MAFWTCLWTSLGCTSSWASIGFTLMEAFCRLSCCPTMLVLLNLASSGLFVILHFLESFFVGGGGPRGDYSMRVVHSTSLQLLLLSLLLSISRSPNTQKGARTKEKCESEQTCTKTKGHMRRPRYRRQEKGTKARAREYATGRGDRHQNERSCAKVAPRLAQDDRLWGSEVAPRWPKMADLRLSQDRPETGTRWLPWIRCSRLFLLFRSPDGFQKTQDFSYGSSCGSCDLFLFGSTDKNVGCHSGTSAPLGRCPLRQSSRQALEVIKGASAPGSPLQATQARGVYWAFKAF